MSDDGTLYTAERGDFGFMVMTVRYVFSSPSTAEIYRILMGLLHDDDMLRRRLVLRLIFSSNYFILTAESRRCGFSQKASGAEKEGGKSYDIGWAEEPASLSLG